WQTSAADVTAEPKFGLWPLVFGTIKATLYAMLFGAPLALMAAIFTSEFLTRAVRLRIKSMVEMMASLPSVVLGFVAALVIAPVAEKIMPAILASLATIPLALLLGACLWQQLPRSTALRYAKWRLPLSAVMLFSGVLFAWLLGPLVERWLFAGNVMLWLDGQQGSGTGGWVIILLPLCGLAAALMVVRWINPWLVSLSGRWGRARFAALNLLKFLAAAACTLLLAEALGALLTLLGFDPRGGVLDTYVQRNALIVGFVMGFAIIPIIYTIAEDALSSVPGHLRSASLGCGATTWQTAFRIVVPTATSGLFSALMVGLGRAVGETMIVLMAAGNVPLTSWNIFSGFQSLSAGIAVELSEASQGSTHYRVLFLAALCLFVLTFVVNTAAEMVRIRFRRRAVQL
ncbi:MAG: ABC transporter permease subunit, partial [Planctomycetes bacterium]|nr:ABC transporter permease subunit [Planctomycetota bacterium]